MYHIVVNPASRSGEGLKVWEEIEPYFLTSGIEYRAHFSTATKTIDRLCRNITGGKEPVDLVVIGGDGTLNEALNGIENFSRVRVGFIPVGSGNDFARDAGIPMDPHEAVVQLLSGRYLRDLDLGQVSWRSAGSHSDGTGSKRGRSSTQLSRRQIEGSAGDFEEGEKKERFFVTSAGVGFDAQICHDANRSRWKKLLNHIRMGQLIYILTGIRLILTAKRARMRISVFEDVFQTEPTQLDLDECLFAVAMNHSYEGGGFRFAPDAVANDGLLDMCVASNISRARFFYLFPKVNKGQHIGKTGIFMLKGRRITIRSDKPLFLHTDGEVPDMTRTVSFTVHRGALHFLN